MATKKKIVAFGRYKDPSDMTKPYYVALLWFEGKPPLLQDCSEEEFFQLLGDIVKKYEPEVDAEVMG